MPQKVTFQLSICELRPFSYHQCYEPKTICSILRTIPKANFTWKQLGKLFESDRLCFDVFEE